MTGQREVVFSFIPAGILLKGPACLVGAGCGEDRYRVMARSEVRIQVFNYDFHYYFNYCQRTRFFLMVSNTWVVLVNSSVSSNKLLVIFKALTI